MAKQSKRNALNVDVSKMDAELGNEFFDDTKRARVIHKVETRVKTSAQRYGFFKRED
ncbi:MAG: hypothetical protein Q4Q00_13200 [Turicibacter sp.]|nr:hypothetical protein [Turicibacter sp.]